MARDKWGNTPLHWAAEHTTTSTIQTLIDANADAKVKNEEGKTPRDLAQ